MWLIKDRLVSLGLGSLTESLVDFGVWRPFAHDARLAEEGGQGLELVLSRRQFGVIQGRQDSHLCQLNTSETVVIISIILKCFNHSAPYLSRKQTVFQVVLGKLFVFVVPYKKTHTKSLRIPCNNSKQTFFKG